MKVFEVGLICEIEGGRGVLIADDAELFTNAKAYLIGAATHHVSSWTVSFDDDDTYEDCSDYKFCDEYKEAAEKALAEIKQANSVSELKAVKIDKLHHRVSIVEREIVMGVNQ